MIEKIFGKVIDFPKFTLCGILLLTMIWALFIPNLTIDFSIEHLFSQNDPASKNISLLEMILEERIM